MKKINAFRLPKQPAYMPRRSHVGSCIEKACMALDAGYGSAAYLWFIDEMAKRKETRENHGIQRGKAFGVEMWMDDIPALKRHIQGFEPEFSNCYNYGIA